MELGRNYIGKQIVNYRIVEKINCGFFGCVYRAEHIHMKRTVAIKILQLSHFGSQQERENFLKEAQLLEILKHPHILPVHDVGIDSEGFPYQISEYASNRSLRDRIQRQSVNPFPLQEALTIITQIGEALQYAHQENIVHRDLKPENILFNSKGNALLADFGIATVLNTARTQHVDVTGSPPYMAPEQFQGTVSKRSDQYALGCITYELLCGRKPFTASDFFGMAFKHWNEIPISPLQFNPQLPRHVELAILKAMAKRREERYDNVSAFLTSLNVSNNTQVLVKNKSLSVVPQIASFQELSTMVLLCPVCMHVAPIGLSNCPRCQTSLAGVVPTLICPRCHSQVVVGVKFCGVCGNPISTKDQQKDTQSCPRCHSQVVVGVKFCDRCGTPMSSVVLQKGYRNCPRCQNQMAEGAKFCDRCGTPMPSSNLMSFCLVCGHDVTGLKFCPVCGTMCNQSSNPIPVSPIDQGSSYCRNCGGKVNHGEVYCMQCGTSLNSLELPADVARDIGLL
jgi:serine/threonine protein kinase/DNA-directed RNA polymerase subunit RPC12/RpoP